MKSIGQMLKAERERRQISIADVAAATKMTNTFVKAIEADNFSALVAPVYARGFIKLYAEFVGLDPMHLLKQFGADGRAMPAWAPTPPSARTAHAGILKPPRLQQSGPLPGNCRATGKPAPISEPPTSPAAGKWSLAAPLAPLAERLAAESGDVTLSRSASLLAGRLSALNRTFIARVRWPRFKLSGRPACNVVCPPAALRAATRLQCYLPAVLRSALQAGAQHCGQVWAGSTAGRICQHLSLPVIIWQRIFIVAGVVLLIIAASLAWEWSSRGMASMTDACRWLAEPPAPYLTINNR